MNNLLLHCIKACVKVAPLLLVRYFLYNLVFQSWKFYILQQREKKKKYCVAEAHGKRLEGGAKTLMDCYRSVSSECII